MDKSKTVRFNPATQPFRTSNAMLAYALYLAKVPFYFMEEGNVRLCLHYYTEAILRAFTDADGQPIYKGMVAIDAARQAHKDGRRGEVVYFFKPLRQIKQLCKAYAAQEKALDAYPGPANDLIEPLLKEIMAGAVSHQVGVVRLACITLKMRMPFMEAWKHAGAWLKVPMDGPTTERQTTVKIRTEKGGVMTVPAKEVTGPGWDAVDIYSSDKTLEKMGVI